jgi:flagellar biosynthesis/type III secretory pathway chaperone
MLEQNMTLTNCRVENECESSFTTLTDILRKELDVYQELKEAMIGEKKILMKPSLDEINQNNARKENIILKARMLEEGRANVLKKIARNLDIDVNRIKIDLLISYAAVEQRKEIEAIKNELAQTLEEINLINEANKELINVSLNCIKSSVDFINSISSTGAVYVGSGKIKTLQVSGKYLRTEG